MDKCGAASNAKCTLCSDPDDGNMIGCAKCHTIYHYSCCHIDDEADIRVWICEFCCQKENSLPNLNKSSEQRQYSVQSNDLQHPNDGSRNERVDVSMADQQSYSGHRTPLAGTFRLDISVKKQLQLRQLEEEMALREEFLKRKYEILQSDNVEESHGVDNNTEEQNVRPVENNRNYSTVSEPPCVHNCQQTVNTTSMNNHCESTNLAQTHTQFANMHLNRTSNIENFALNQPQCQSTSRSYQPLYPNINGTYQLPDGHTLNTPYANNQNNNMNTLTATNVNTTTNDRNISTSQMFARQSFSKDLPTFNGDPREWPIFISAFEQSTSVAGYSNDENLIRLQKCLHGKARDAVRNCLMLPDMVPDIIRTLKMYFGRPEYVLKNLIDDLRKMSLPRGKLESIIEFAFAIKNICATIRASKLDDYLTNPTLLQELIGKLSPDMMLQWAMHSKDIHRPNLIDFSDWLYTIAEATCKVTVPVFDTSYDQKSSRKDSRLNTHSTTLDQKPAQQCVVCDEQHKLSQCPKFSELPTTERWDIVKSMNLCRNCLGKHRRKCWFQRQCGVNGCTVHHNALLHSYEQPSVSSLSTLNNHTSSNVGGSFFRIVRVTLYNNKNVVTIYALMDDGSTLTLLEEAVAEKLGVRGTNDPLCIRWTGDVVRFEDSSKIFDLQISSTKTGSKVYPIKNVHTVKNLNLSTETMVVHDVKGKYPYLEDIPIEGYENVVPSMIIGINNPNLISSLKIREGKWNQPVASKTRLGWTLFGGSSMTGKLNLHMCTCSKDEELHELVKHYFSEESVGVSPPLVDPMSSDDERALRIMEETCKFNNGRYEVGLLWKNENTVLPNSLPTAMKRLQCIRQRANRDPQMAEILHQQIVNLEEKGYAKKLPATMVNEKGGKIWYLPTFIVKNPHKPNKLRLVWDAAAKSENVALNDFLLKGPDLLRPLMHILFKFRMGVVAVCGDIAEMFHRIKVREEDACSQRFLWWDKNNSVVVYQLDVLTFGASCSPFISHYVRDKNSERFGQDDPKVIEAITRQHYVDDFIDSTNTVAEAINLALRVREVHAQGGFQMRNWSSNSCEVLEALGEANVAQNKTFDGNENLNDFEKILGLYWDAKNDLFKINLKFVRIRRPIFTEAIIPTKREVLQVLMSVFDPLGFVACFMSYLKSVLQEIWRSRIDWDETLSEDLYNKWKNWLTFLPIITNVSIPRCYSPKMSNEGCTIQLHTFVDASEDAYAAVSYFRIEADGGVEIKLIGAKSKVAPLRPLSVPRLELQAAAIGARLMKTICCHNIKLQRRVMWTDSKTVLHWLIGDPRKYKQFVMFRIAEILKYTEASDWRWVPSALNVADFATKFRPPTDIYKEWFDGPTWLKKSESEWPKTSGTVEGDTSELRARYLHIHTRKSMFLSINFEYFSSWFRLYRAVGNWIMLAERLQQKVNEDKDRISLNASHLNKAKTIIFKEAQMTCFMDDYMALLNENSILKGGAFEKLNVYIDNNGVVKVKNRAHYADAVCGVQRDLIILSGKHHLTKLIVMHYHRAFHHLNHETVLNEIRQIYFIIKLRVVYKSVRRNCQYCKVNLAKPVAPQMSPLPPARLGAYQRPFTYVGVDYFGPIAVISGRKSLKRWGVLFTCLTVRAIHLEIAHTLSTDSFLMCLRNFISRRGIPAEIYSDNGTNFRGADRFLKEELKNIKFDEVQIDLAYRGITWKFNPPAAPHMGGAWERLVRSVKAVLNKISPSQKFTDESLRSALMEVELIVNSRPLTYVSLETEDQEAITPNHFLVGSSNGSKPFCIAENIDYRMCLRQSEMFANMFWRRWIKEMLPTLTRRSKWFEKVKPISEGDIVIIVDENTVRNSWLKGKVVAVTTAADGQVRRAKVQTKNGIMERPAVKLAVLDVGNGLK